jgi:hypothetical protein
MVLRGRPELSGLEELSLVDSEASFVLRERGGGKADHDALRRRRRKSSLPWELLGRLSVCREQVHHPLALSRELALTSDAGSDGICCRRLAFDSRQRRTRGGSQGDVIYAGRLGIGSARSGAGYAHLRRQGQAGQRQLLRGVCQGGRRYVPRLSRGDERELMLLHIPAVDIKYVSLHHFIELTYNGVLRRLLVSFARAPITSSTPPPRPTSNQVYTVSRATVIIFKPPIAPLPKKRPPTSTAIVPGAGGAEGELPGYEAIGGMESQIEQIRELVEWPLTRPELYNHFGSFPFAGSSRSRT